VIHLVPIIVSEGLQYEPADPLFYPFQFVHGKYFTWATDFSVVDLFSVLRSVKEMLPVISEKLRALQE
jgi:hypothetical protein